MNKNIDNDITSESFEVIVEKLFENNSIAIPTIAKKMSISVSTLERMIKVKYEQTPKQYITEFKLSKSALLLRQRKLSVKQVASESRFNSVAYFCFCFKKAYGKSPKSYANSFEQRD